MSRTPSISRLIFPTRAIVPWYFVPLISERLWGIQIHDETYELGIRWFQKNTRVISSTFDDFDDAQEMGKIASRRSGWRSFLEVLAKTIFFSWTIWSRSWPWWTGRFVVATTDPRQNGGGLRKFTWICFLEKKLSNLGNYMLVLKFMSYLNLTLKSNMFNRHTNFACGDQSLVVSTYIPAQIPTFHR